MKKSNRKQEVFEKNCGDDDCFITVLAVTLSFLVVTLSNAILTGTNGPAISLMILTLWWLIFAAFIMSFYESIKNKEI